MVLLFQAPYENISGKNDKSFESTTKKLLEFWKRMSDAASCGFQCHVDCKSTSFTKIKLEGSKMNIFQDLLQNSIFMF